MGAALEVITGRATNPGAGPVALTPGSGDTFAVRNFDSSAYAYLEDIWGQSASAGFVRVRSPRLHDNVQGIRVRQIAANTRSLLGDESRQNLYAQDNLIIEAGGGAAETDMYAFLLQYSDIPGLDAQLATWDQVSARLVNLLTIEVATATSATAGDWPAGTAINATNDLLKANTFYAILGYIQDVATCVTALRGPDTGNVRIGGPGTTEALETRSQFVDNSQRLGIPGIPIINSANKQATLVYTAGPAVSANVNVDLIACELSGSLF